VTGVVDSRGLPCAAGTEHYAALPQLDLTVASAGHLKNAVRAIDTAAARGPTLVCCALGFSRSALAGRRVAHRERARARRAGGGRDRAPGASGLVLVPRTSRRSRPTRVTRRPDSVDTSLAAWTPDAPPRCARHPGGSSRLRLRCRSWGLTCGARADGLSWRRWAWCRSTSPRGRVRPRDIRSAAASPGEAAHFDAALPAGKMHPQKTGRTMAQRAAARARFVIAERNRLHGAGVLAAASAWAR